MMVKMDFTKNVFITFITRLLQVVFRLLGGIIAARALGPAPLGMFALIQMVTGIATTLGSLGVSDSIVYFAGKLKEKIPRIAVNVLLLGLIQGFLLMLLILLCLPTLQDRFESLQNITQTLWIMALASIPLQLLMVYFNSLIRGQNKIGLFNRNNFLIAIIHFLLIVIFLIPLNMGLSGRVLAFTVGSGLGAVVTFWGVKSFYRQGLKPSLPLAGDMLRFGSIIHATTVIQFLNYRLDIFLLGYFCTAMEVGHYYVAVTLGEMLWYLPNAIGTVLFPILAGGKNENSRLTTTSARNNLFIIFVLSALVFVGAELIIKICFSSAYLPAIIPLQFLLPGIVGFSLAKILSPHLISKGYARIVAAIALISLVVNISLNLVLIPQYHAAGAAIASSVSYITGILIMITVYSRITGSSLKDILLVNRKDLKGYLMFTRDNILKLKELISKKKLKD